MSPRRNWDSPTPSPASKCTPNPGSKGEGHPRLRVRGWESPNFEDWGKALSTLWFYKKGGDQLARIPSAYTLMALSHVADIVNGLAVVVVVAAVVVVAGVVVGANVVIPSIGGHGQVAKSGWVGPLQEDEKGRPFSFH
jgi:hypothetical protein